MGVNGGPPIKMEGSPEAGEVCVWGVGGDSARLRARARVGDGGGEQGLEHGSDACLRHSKSLMFATAQQEVKGRGRGSGTGMQGQEGRCRGRGKSKEGQEGWARVGQGQDGVRGIGWR